MIPELKINSLWKVVGGRDNDRSYLKASELICELENSVILGNAFKLCPHSKKLQLELPRGFVEQKFKSFLYMN